MLKEKYSPLFYLASLGAGGLSVSFYMYLMFMIPHGDAPMATYDHIMPYLMQGNLSSLLIAFCLVFIIALAFLHFKLLIWNYKEYKAFKETKAFNQLKSTNAEVTLMAIPLTLTMTINVCFVLGAVFVPELWSVVEYLFPGALLGFMATGYYAIKLFMDYFSRIISTGEFDFTTNNNLSQMISIFAFSMIAVGFAAPGAMSENIAINAIGIFFAIFFACISLLLILIKLIFGFQIMFEKGIGKEASPSLWIMIPILTLLGITFIRVSFGLDHHFGQPLIKASLFTLTSLVVAFQIIFGLLGYAVMKKIGYFEEFIHGDKQSSSSFALICPGVAFMVFGMFFINMGLVFNGVVDKYSIAYYILILPYAYIQYKTLIYFFKLKSKFAL